MPIAKEDNLNHMKLPVSTFFFTLFFIILNLHLSAQTVFTLTDNQSDWVRSGAILTDKNYTIEQVASDTTLPFVADSLIYPAKTPVVWVRFKVFNPFLYAQSRIARFFPILDNTLYYFDEQTQKWIAQKNGLLVESNKRSFMNMPCVLQANKVNVVYVKTDMTRLMHSPNWLKSSISFDKEEEIASKKQFTDTLTAITVFVVLAFFLFNAYIYYIFRDKTYFYYLITQIGGIFYMLSSTGYMNVLFKKRFAILELDETGGIFFSEINTLIMRLSTVVILVGFIQLTRAYLNTKSLMRKHDLGLKYLLYTLLLVNAVRFAMTFSGAMKDMLLLSFENGLAVIIAAYIVYVSVVAYRRKYPAARYFLLANIVSLFLIGILGATYLLNPTTYNPLMYASNIAVVAQALCLALALVERFLLIKNELQQKKLEAQELAAQNERIAAENKLHKTELLDYTQLLREKSEALEKLKTEFEKRNMTVSYNNLLEQMSQESILTDEQWRNFKFKFENVHTDFFNRLQLQVPTVTEAEKRLLALTKLGMTNTEMATILGISPDSVTKTRYRLRKKIEVEDLERFAEAI